MPNKPEWENQLREKIRNVYNNIFQISGYDKKQLLYKEDRMIDFVHFTIRLQDRDGLFKMLPGLHELGQSGFPIREEYKEGYNDAINEVKQAIKDYYNN